MYEMIGYGGKPDAERRACFDCTHCKAAISWWCMNKDAIAARMTRIPDASNCPHWAPIRTEFTRWERWFGVDKSRFILVSLARR